MGVAMSDGRDRGRARGRLLLIAMLMLVSAALGACTETSSEDDLERRAQRLDRSLICPLCPSETIDQSQVLLAAQMRVTVRERLAEGWSEDEIRQYFVDRYGERVLAAPPKEGFNLLAWAVPPAIVIASLLVLAWVVREMQARKRTPQAARERPAEARDETALAPYLALVDRESGGAGTTRAEAPGASGPPTLAPESSGREGEL